MASIVKSFGILGVEGYLVDVEVKEIEGQLETEQCILARNEEFAYIGELSLNVKLRGCSGVLPMIIAAKESGMKNIIVPLDNVR